MRRLLTGKAFRILTGIVIFFLITALVSSGNSYINHFLTSYLLTPIQQLTAKGTDALGKALTPPADTEALEQENSRLKEENRRLHDMLVNYYDIKRENEELERFYSIKRENRDFSVVMAVVIGRDPNENFYGFTLDRGSSDGVELNDPVMTENGLVGWVCEVSPKSCKAATILSPDAGIGAVVKRTGDSGILSGGAVMADDGLTRMINLSSQHTIQQEDIVVTSGYGGIFPKNIKIGKVKTAALDEYSGMPAAVIEPFEDIRTVTSAVIITDFTGKADTEEELYCKKQENQQ